MHQDESIPIYKRWWFWIIGVELLALVFVVGILFAQNNTDSLQPEKEPPATAATQTEKQKPQKIIADASQVKAIPAEGQKEKNEKKVKKEKQSNIILPNPALHIGMTPAEFQEDFNESSELIGFDYMIENLPISQGKVQNTIYYELTKTLSIFGTVNKKTGKLRDLSLIVNTNGTMPPEKDMLVTMDILIDLIHPGLTPFDRQEILDELAISKDYIDVDHLDHTSKRENIKYHTLTVPKVGFIFIISHVNDKAQNGLR